jgi:hypothetical protein
MLDAARIAGASVQDLQDEQQVLSGRSLRGWWSEPSPIAFWKCVGRSPDRSFPPRIPRQRKRDPTRWPPSIGPRQLVLEPRKEIDADHGPLISLDVGRVCAECSKLWITRVHWCIARARLQHAGTVGILRPLEGAVKPNSARVAVFQALLPRRRLYVAIPISCVLRADRRSSCHSMEFGLIERRPIGVLVG